jgi:hypothetical protein
MYQKYLEKYRSTLSTSQGNQILRILTKQRDSGEVRTIDEFRDRLKKLTGEILAERITPTLKLYKAVPGEDTSSDQFNDMVARVQDDLETAFNEAENLDEIIAAHHNVINQVALKVIHFGINDLESKITLYEFLGRNTRGFDDALFNTFREASNRKLSRSDQAASLVYIDPRRRSAILSNEDTEVDFMGERLILGAREIHYHKIREARWLSNPNSIRGEMNVEFSNSRISHIIDEQSNTYWVVPILLRQVRATGVPMEIVLRMPASRDINFVEIEPACEFPMVLTAVEYFDSNGNRQRAMSTEVTVSSPMKINFGRITTSALILQFKQDNYRETQFRRKAGESNFHRAVLGEHHSPVDLVSVSNDLRELLSSDFILSDIMNVPQQVGTMEKYYEYLIGFDNIRVGFNTFNERGIFASIKKPIDHLGQAALRVDEIRPVQVQGSHAISLQPFTYPQRSFAEDQKFYHSTVEYWLVVQLFGEDDFLISTENLPILPLGAKRIYHEQVILTDKSESGLTNPDQGSLMFYADADEDDVLMYRNGTLLEHGSGKDWIFVPGTGLGSNANITITSPNAGRRMKRGIQILDTVRPLDIYTVSYTPRVSNTQIVPADTSLLSIVDLVGDQSIRMIYDNVVIFDTIRLSYKIIRADVYLSIIMRRNSADLNFSPAVEEYMLVVGSRDLNKFVSEE